jgi:hypothetical protein
MKSQSDFDKFAPETTSLFNTMCRSVSVLYSGQGGKPSMNKPFGPARVGIDVLANPVNAIWMNLCNDSTNVVAPKRGFGVPNTYGNSYAWNASPCSK